MSETEMLRRIDSLTSELRHAKRWLEVERQRVRELEFAISRQSDEEVFVVTVDGKRDFFWRREGAEIHKRNHENAIVRHARLVIGEVIK